MSGSTVLERANVDVHVKVGDTPCMTAQMYPVVAPSESDLAAARAVLKADRLARMRELRAERRAKRPSIFPRFPTAAYLCGYCGTPFTARVLQGPVIGRWCSNSCRQLGYQARRRRLERREAARAAVLAGQA
jgi:hypothetical protein